MKTAWTTTRSLSTRQDHVLMVGTAKPGTEGHVFIWHLNTTSLFSYYRIPVLFVFEVCMWVEGCIPSVLMFFLQVNADKGYLVTCHNNSIFTTSKTFQ